MNSADLTHLICVYFGSRFERVLCNQRALHSGFESDLIGYTKSGLIHEIEIKVSRSDFKADFLKSCNSALKHELIQLGKLADYFWFAVPAGLISESDVPDYAGLLEVERFFVRQIRRAPRLHIET